MFLMSRKIKSLGVKMVLSGEGSDEIFGGYLYFHKAPNKEEFHEETCRKVLQLSLTFINVFIKNYIYIYRGRFIFHFFIFLRFFLEPDPIYTHTLLTFGEV